MAGAEGSAVSSKRDLSKRESWGLLRGSGKTADQIVYRPDPTVETLSDNGPGDDDKKLNEKLLAELRAQGSFADEASDVLREKALDKVHQLVADWVLDLSERKGENNIKSRTQACRVIPFGSYTLGVHSSDSDIDVLCIVPKHVSRHEFFSEMPDILKAQEGLDNLHSVPEARVPVIKFTFNSIDVDLGIARTVHDALPDDLDVMHDHLLKGVNDPTDVTCLNGPRVTFELLKRVPNRENFGILLRFLKLWARRRGIYANIVGFPGGVAWAILAAKVCQLYPNMIPSQLLEKFFFLYKNWNFENPIIIAPLNECQPPEGAAYMPSFNPQTLNPMTRRPMSVITPTYPTANATFNSSDSTLKVLQKQVSDAYVQLALVAREKRTFKSMLAPLDFFKDYSNYVQVEAIAHKQESMKPWYGFLESQIRKLVEQLQFDEYAGLELAHPCTQHFGPVCSDTEPEYYQVFFFLGLKFDAQLVEEMKKNGQSVNLTHPVAEFLQILQASRENYEEVDIGIKVVKRKSVPDWIRRDYFKSHGLPVPLERPASNPPAGSSQPSTPTSSAATAAKGFLDVGAKRKAEAEAEGSERRQSVEVENGPDNKRAKP